MNKRRYLIYVVLISFFVLVVYRIANLCIVDRDKYNKLYNDRTSIYFKGYSARRGRILDVNGKVLVDNIGVNTVVYNSTLNKDEDLVDVAYLLGSVLKFDENKFSMNGLKEFYLLLNDDGDDLISSEEWNLYKKRLLSKEDIQALKYDRVSEEMLDSLEYEDRNASYIYGILSKGYYYQDKVIKKGISDEEVSLINDLNISGVEIKLLWDRYYPYGDTLKSIFGRVNTIPFEEKDYYEEKNISLDSIVGVSFLERQYDDHLRGEDALYKIINGKVELVSEEKPGEDLYLSIDIDKQLEIERIVKEEMMNAKNAPNSKYYNHSYVIVGHPKTGEIVSLVALYYTNGKFIDVSANVINSSYTVGSIVKGATISVGYQQGVIKEGKKVLDSCIKVYGVTEKCSWTRLGYIDDIRALAQSSNYYQFLIVTKLTNPNYRWNSKLGVTKEHFDIYRNMLSSYGLGSITGIDLPGERIGIIGKRVSDDLLLNLAIGQYDTYTPIEVFQYINTIANDGIRVKPRLGVRIGNTEIGTSVLNEVDLPNEKIKRIQTGLREVIRSGTGRGYLGGVNIDAAGKTGTSETFIDTNGDGKMDKATTSTAFIMYAPISNPEYSIVIMSPNIGYDGYKYSINSRINRKIVKYLFEKS